MSVLSSNQAILTLPTSTDTLIGRVTTDTLTNKTLTAPVILTISINTGLLTLPTGQPTDTLVGRLSVDTLSNKTLTNPVISTIINTGTLTLPTSTDTLVGRSTTDTLTNKTYGDFTCTATTESHLNGKYILQSSSLTTTDATATTTQTIAVPNNRAITLTAISTSYDTASTTGDANKSASRLRTARITNVAGTVTVGATLENNSSQDTGLAAIAVNFVASGSNVLVQMTGIANNTIDHTVITQSYYI